VSDDWNNYYQKTTYFPIWLQKRGYHLVFHFLQGFKIPIRDRLVLEVGCGDGLFCNHASMRGANVVGVEISKAALSKANQKSLGNYSACDAHNLPFPSNTFDVVVSAEVLEHIPAYEEAFSEIVRACRRNGYIIITVPTQTNITALYCVINYIMKKVRRYEEQPKDVNKFTPETLKKLSDNHKLQILSMKGIGLIWLPTRNRKINKILNAMEKPQNRFKGFCMNIGLIAKKQ
jgi:2-polyprenyl-3-methyl-5-hydroxy-6-metoxy-1,4-benzoquinol methylase